MSDQINDLEQIIEDSVNDAVNPEPADTDVSTDDSATVSADDATEDSLRGHGEEQVEESNQIETPGNKPVEGDDFAKKFGLQPNSVTGRENRIPYSRVKKMVEKTEKDTVARLTKEFETKYAKYPEIETKVKDYEDRLGRVAQFEQILDSDPKTFLGMLSQHPAYQEFFKYVENLAAGQQAPAQQQQAADPTGGMPQPDQTLADGSAVYSMEGLQKLMAWQETQAIQKAIKQVEQRYAPIEQAWQSQEQIAKIVPIVEKQIAEARTWDQFETLEPRVVELLKADKNITLERAYVKAYQEWSAGERTKLVADKNKVRQEVIADMKKKPTASSAPVGAVKSAPADGATPRSTEDIIREELQKAGLLQ